MTETAIKSKLGCVWLEEGMYIEASRDPTLNDPVSKNIGIKSCCRIATLPEEFALDGQDHLTYTQLQKNRNNLDYNFDSLKDNACIKCHKDEQLHGTSMRTRANFHAYNKLPVNVDNKFRYMQITFSSFCNLKCKYCGTYQSTAWNDDVDISEGMMKVRTTNTETYAQEKQIIDLCKKTDISGLKFLGVFGGEPFMARHFSEFMELVEEKADTSRMYLQINTNSSIFPKDKIIKILQNFGKVDLRVSNESVGKLSEYIRNGSKWDSFERNTNKWLEASEGTGIDVQVHATHCVWNINKVEEFHNWATSTGIPVFNSSTHKPLYSNVSAVLTESQRKECSEIIDNMPDCSTKKFTKNMLKSNHMDKHHDEALREFKKFTRIFDQRSPYTLKEVNPELFAWTH